MSKEFLSALSVTVCVRSARAQIFALFVPTLNKDLLTENAFATSEPTRTLQQKTAYPATSAAENAQGPLARSVLPAGPTENQNSFQPSSRIPKR